MKKIEKLLSEYNLCDIEDYDDELYNLSEYARLSKQVLDVVNYGEHSAGYLDYDYIEELDENIYMYPDFEVDVVNTIGYFLFPSELIENIDKKLNGKTVDEAREIMRDIYYRIRII